jgi:hypothetical protein
VDLVRSLAVSEVVEDGADRLVDGEVTKVDTESGDLGVEVGEVSSLEQGIVGVVDSGDDVAGAESDLLGLGKVVGDVSVEGHGTDELDGELLLGPDYRTGRAE